MQEDTADETSDQSAYAEAHRRPQEERADGSPTLPRRVNVQYETQPYAQVPNFVGSQPCQQGMTVEYGHPHEDPVITPPPDAHSQENFELRLHDPYQPQSHFSMHTTDYSGVVDSTATNGVNYASPHGQMSLDVISYGDGNAVLGNGESSGLIHQPRAEAPFDMRCLLLPPDASDNKGFSEQDSSSQGNASTVSSPRPESVALLNSASTPSPFPKAVASNTIRGNWDPDDYRSNSPITRASQFPLHVRNLLIDRAILYLHRDMFSEHVFLDRDGGPRLNQAMDVVSEAAQNSRLFITAKQREYYADVKPILDKVVYDSRVLIFERGRDQALEFIIESLELNCPEGCDPVAWAVQSKAKVTALAMSLRISRENGDEMLIQNGMQKYTLPVVEVLLFLIFYSDDDRLGKKFREFFPVYVPHTMVAFVICLIEHVLSLYIETGTRIDRDINYIVFRATYEEEMRALAALDAYGPQLRAQLKYWTGFFNSVVYDPREFAFKYSRATGPL